MQEALTNATEHGLAHRAVVEVIERDEAVHVAVRDDGHGFDPAVKTSGFGLLGMRERAELLGGTVAATPPPAEGQRSKSRCRYPAAKATPSALVRGSSRAHAAELSRKLRPSA